MIRTPNVSDNVRIAYLSEVDVSINNGRGINEREFVRVLRERHGDRVVCILPAPASPANYADPGIVYVSPHKNAATEYARHLAASFAALRACHGRVPFGALVTRLEVSPIVPIAARELLGIPTILKTLALYQNFSAGSVRGFRPHQILGRLMRPLFRSVVTKALGCDTPSESLAQFHSDVFALNEKRVRTIPNGCNIRLFAPGDAGAARARLGLGEYEAVIGYVGSLGALRNLELLIRAVARLAARSNVALVLVGDGEHRVYLERLAAELGIGEAVLFMGQVDYEDVPLYMRACDVAVDLTLVPLDSGPRRFEGSFSQKIPQYLACGLPVVAWKTPDNGFLEEQEVGTLVEPESGESELCCALERELTQGQGRRPARSRRARHYAETTFDIEGLTENRVEWWLELVASDMASRRA